MSVQLVYCDYARTNQEVGKKAFLGLLTEKNHQ